MNRTRMHITGEVQGVGFRPFVLRLATSLGLTGHVLNSATGVAIEAEGSAAALALFSMRLYAEAPAAARIALVETEDRVVLGTVRFEIRDSLEGPAQVGLVPDLAVCTACLAELRDPGNRRFRYPFVTCASCGPRFSVAFALPYDRQRTSMRAFPLCRACLREYEDPNDRRYHAQGISCAMCGPRLSAWDAQGRELAHGDAALQHAMAALDSGGIVALKGLTGFQLLVAADQDAAVARLRARKARPAKPFAVLVRAVADVARWATLDPHAVRELTAPEAPVVLLPGRPRPEPGIASAVSSGAPLLGVLLPTTPLHQLLSDARSLPLVVTSGNRSSEPLCRTNSEALERLREVADLWLVHDRDIVHAMDDSVLRIAAGRRCLLRRARGFVPRILHSAEALPDMLALGGHGKNTVAISRGHAVLVSQHLGDLDSEQNRANHLTTARELPGLLAATPQHVVTDLHPDYATHATADESCAVWSARRVTVQHHLAHVLAVVAEHDIRDAVLGVAWDGSGLGSDSRLWGGEFFRVDMAERRAQRIAHLRPLPLIGGERAAREPRRIALALLRETFGPGWLEHELCREPLARFDYPAETLHNLDHLAGTGTSSVLCTSVRGARNS